MTSPMGITTYIGAYTRRESFVDGKAEGIYVAGGMLSRSHRA